MRNRLVILCWAVVIGAGSSAAAKPPGLPADPLVNGVEPTPVAREFYLTDGSPVSSGQPEVTSTSQFRPIPISTPGSDLVALAVRVGCVVLDRVTVPLGMAMAE